VKKKINTLVLRWESPVNKTTIGNVCRLLLVLPVVFLMVTSTSVSRADQFLFNFSRPPNSTFNPNDFTYDGASYFAEGSCSSSQSCKGNDFTAFSQQVVDVGGTKYWRNVVGELSSGFAYEYYTRAGLNAIGNVSGFRGFGTDTGGMEQGVHGDGLCPSVNASVAGPCGNGADPFSVYTMSGNGTGDPSKMVFRLVMDDGNGMTMEVFKPVLDGKPKITQTIIDGDMRSEFISDMRALSYSDMDTAAPVINRQRIDDPSFLVPGAADFEMAMAQDTHITAGRFTFTPGTKWSDPNLGWAASGSTFGQGTYTYAEDNGFDVLLVDWGSYFNFSDNATACFSTQRSSHPESCPQ